MRAAQIENGKVKNVIEVGSLDVLPGLVPGTDAGGRHAEPGDDWDGNQFIKALPAPQEVPQVLQMYQAHLALIERGHMARVRQVLNAMQGKDGEKARTYFDQSPTMKRRHALVLLLMPQIPLTDAEVDELFIFADANF